MKYLSIVLSILSVSGALGASEEVVPAAASRFERRDTKAVPDFQKHVVPLLGRLGCNSAKCHGSFQGQGDFRLSLFGFDFQADHSALHAAASSEDGNRLNRSAPEDSLIVLKSTEQTDHEGGQRLEPDSWEHHLLLRWIESGAEGAQVTTAPMPSEINKYDSAPAGSGQVLIELHY